MSGSRTVAFLFLSPIIRLDVRILFPSVGIYFLANVYPCLA